MTPFSDRLEKRRGHLRLNLEAHGIGAHPAVGMAIVPARVGVLQARVGTDLLAGEAVRAAVRGGAGLAGDDAEAVVLRSR